MMSTNWHYIWCIFKITVRDGCGLEYNSSTHCRVDFPLKLEIGWIVRDLFSLPCAYKTLGCSNVYINMCALQYSTN